LKLLLFSDLHRDLEQGRQLAKMAEIEAVDAVIGAGDFGSVRRGLKEVIEVLRQITRPAILVPGNSESDAELRDACQTWPSAVVLHGAGTTVNQVDFWGIGGGIPVTPFGPWSFDFSEEQARAMLAGCPEGAVLVSHSPPKGVADVSGGRSLGSLAIREAILAKKPRLVVCGHIHACAGKVEMIGDTPVVNVGPQGMIWEL
jgi:Icc-related predicted phosphoesterase